MEFKKLIQSLERFKKILPVVVEDLTNLDAAWKPPTGEWSILEIVCHLVDEETEDFRTRVKLTLEDPTLPWPPTDPEGLAVERKYNEQDIHKVVERFVTERTTSIEWLNEVKAPNWHNAYEHPKFGKIQAGEVMVSWAAHDQLHLRQIAKRMFQMNVRDGSPYVTDYAGEWKA